MKEVMVMMIGLLLSGKMDELMKNSEKESFTKDEITSMLAEACSLAMEDMSKDKE